jgi:hypothetical protein
LWRRLFLVFPAAKTARYQSESERHDHHPAADADLFFKLRRCGLQLSYSPAT